MWTEEHRRTYRREGEGYPSDLRDAEWARLEPLIPKASPGGRPRKTDMWAAMNAILYLLRTRCPWRLSAPLDGLQHLPQVPARGDLGGDLGRAAYDAA
jgi:putative transposase